MTLFLKIKTFKNSNVLREFCDYPYFSNRGISFLYGQVMIVAVKTFFRKSAIPF